MSRPLIKEGTNRNRSHSHESHFDGCHIEIVKDHTDRMRFLGSSFLVIINQEKT